MKRYFVALIVIFGLVEANVYAVTTRIFISNRTVPIAEGRKLVNGRMDFNWTNKQGYQTAKLERNGVIEVGVVYDDGTTDIKNLVMNLDDEIYFMELDWALGVIRAQKKANKDKVGVIIEITIDKNAENFGRSSKYNIIWQEKLPVMDANRTSNDFK